MIDSIIEKVNTIGKEEKELDSIEFGDLFDKVILDDIEISPE